MNLQLFIPELTLAIFAIAVILLDLFVQRKGVLAGVSVAGLVISAGFTLTMWGSEPQTIFNNMLAVDSFALFFKLLFTGIAILVILASVDYASKLTHLQGEYYALVLLSVLGMMLMAAATELISIYVALGLTSLSLCALVGFLKDSKSSEAALKYFLLSAMVSAVLLFGMALVFGVTGETQLSKIAQVIQAMPLTNITDNPALVLGVVLLIVGFGFKIAAVPFHMWVPDVYEGAPTPITAYLSVGSKAAGFAVILRIFSSAFGLPEWLSLNWGMLFAVLAAISMTLGNVVALPQTNIKRMLGYSSIAQAGYLMVGLATVGILPTTDVLGQSSILFFLASYTVTNLGAFIAIIAISNKTNSDLIQDFSGMIRRAPGLTLALTLCLVSLIGMPPAAGFMAKFYIFSAGVHSGLLWLVIIAVLNSVISAYYYLRVVKVMWFGEPTSTEKVFSSGALRFSLFITSIGILLLGILPGLVMKLTEAASKMLAFLP
ncbi:MAG: NADH-quinone oxidoreductase subunit N [Dehalococcoidales bacterium]|nr:NADH-quinone oxidoreductase subunit N [Dehalococcoidales bacterium]MDP7409852.1 NADH-quinone oxidoreductase subunit N [Dehalococcoidales bacterium]MDP7676244.1 NADH-quinone oxidoreductase subunit N [Dehalococcoidales bacterium]